MLALRALSLLASTLLVSAAHITISIPGSQILPNPSTLPSSTHAILLGPPGTRYNAPIRRDNTLHFTDVPAASYLLTVHSRDYFFPPVRIDVSQVSSSEQLVEAWATFRGNEWSNKGASYGTSAQGRLTVDLRPSGVKEFYQVRGGFNIIGFLKSPMILMALVSVVMIFGLPYIMENMDPEAKAEFEEIQKKSPLTGSGGAAAQLQGFDMAGWLAGKQSTDSGSAGTAGKKK